MLKFRLADKKDVDTYYNWANDPEVRANSYVRDEIPYENHVKWFLAKVISENAQLYLFLNDGDTPVGQVRIDRIESETIIGISIDKAFRGQSLATLMLQMATDNYLGKHPEEKIYAYIKIKNEASLRGFLKAGFILQEKVSMHGEESYRLLKSLT